MLALIERFHRPVLQIQFPWGTPGSSVYPILCGIIIGGMIGAFSVKRWRGRLLAAMLILSGMLFLQWMRLRAATPLLDDCARNIQVIRGAAMAYLADRNMGAPTLDELIRGGYLRSVPACPLDGSDSYRLDPCDCGGHVYCSHARLD